MSTPQPDDDQHAPLLPTSAPHPHGGSAEAVGVPKVGDTGTSWSTWQLKMTKSTGMISPYLQLAMGMILVVLLWAWWPFGGFGSGVDCVESDPAWPTNIGYAGPTPSKSLALRHLQLSSVRLTKLWCAQLDLRRSLRRLLIPAIVTLLPWLRPLHSRLSTTLRLEPTQPKRYV